MPPVYNQIFFVQVFVCEAYKTNHVFKRRTVELFKSSFSTKQKLNFCFCFFYNILVLSTLS